MTVTGGRGSVAHDGNANNHALAIMVGLMIAIGVMGVVSSGLAKSTASATFDVRSFGAAGNGRHNDTPAINRAIVAANQAGGGTVEVPRGRYLVGGSIHILSNVTLRLE